MNVDQALDRMFPKFCQRCGSEMRGSIMSTFNTQIICFDCKDQEMKHPDYERAREAEMEAVRRGDYNFPGIGWTPIPKTSSGIPEQERRS